MSKKYFVIDFDSTFTKVEALDILCEIAYEGQNNKDEVAHKIKSITDDAMEGRLSFREALQSRVDLLNADKGHVNELIKRLRNQVSESVKRNKQFFKDYSSDLLIISSGFKDFIEPIVTEYGIKPENVYANTFEYDDQGRISGFDAQNPLSEHEGKVKLMKQLKLDGDVYVIGDGYTDFEIRKAGLASKFYAFTENIERSIVTENADHIAPNFEEILFTHNLPMATSYPKNRIKVLLLENIHADAKAKLEKEGYNVELLKGALDEEELAEKIKDVHILGIRSKTQLTRKVLENANRLMLVGAFCIGTNQIDLEACQEKGVAVFNAPYSNTRSVVELAIGEIILLMRNIPQRMREMDKGQWSKSAANAQEVRGKNLGIVGYGNIGAQVSIIAEMMGMNVFYYDIVEKLALGNATKVSSLQELLELSDIVTLHIDGRPENNNTFGAQEFSWMKEGAIFVNLARGPVVDIDALKEVLDNGKLRGAAVDVFPVEPKNNKEKFDSALNETENRNLILTPHIGGSTEEAQVNIADFVPSKMIEYVNTGSTFNSVNFPNLQLPQLENAHRLLHIHKNVSGILAKINNVLANHNINIVGQYLKTNEKIGYVITDIDKAYGREVIEELKAIDDTIKFRVLY
ncbi:phosphoglycerate dehydrogenase [Algivirga pacifica]|uniref:D-3-phosphoglycerate dehydrogenase n=1 Tax=Algivirga pacifica TaxID=1162670 RepID=A0ABP9D5T5_9BACT